MLSLGFNSPYRNIKISKVAIKTSFQWNLQQLSSDTVSEFYCKAWILTFRDEARRKKTESREQRGMWIHSAVFTSRMIVMCMHVCACCMMRGFPSFPLWMKGTVRHFSTYDINKIIFFFKVITSVWEVFCAVCCRPLHLTKLSKKNFVCPFCWFSLTFC